MEHWGIYRNALLPFESFSILHYSNSPIVMLN